MASLKNVYIDPDTLGAGTGIDLANAYDSLWAAEAGEQASLTSLDIYIHFLECTTGGSADVTPTSIGGYGTDATHYILITSGPGYGHSGKWDNSKARIVTADAVSIAIQQAFTYLAHLQLGYNYTTVNYSYVVTIYYSAVPSSYYYYNNIVRTFGGGAITCFYTNHANASVYAFCNLISASGRGYYQGSAGHGYLYNNTIYNCGADGIYIAATVASFTAKNNIVANTANDFNVLCAVFTIDHNASDDGDGTNPIAASGGNWNNEFTSIAGDDFTLLPSGNCFGAGVADPGSGLYWADIIGVPFSAPWNVGAFSSVSVFGALHRRLRGD